MITKSQSNQSIINTTISMKFRIIRTHILPSNTLITGKTIEQIHRNIKYLFPPRKSPPTPIGHLGEGAHKAPTNILILLLRYGRPRLSGQLEWVVISVVGTS